jgi:hypothetical protein
VRENGRSLPLPFGEVVAGDADARAYERVRLYQVLHLHEFLEKKNSAVRVVESEAETRRKGESDEDSLYSLYVLQELPPPVIR